MVWPLRSATDPFQSLGNCVILISVQIETNYPRPSSEAAQTNGVGGEPGQSRFQLADDAGQIVEHAVGEFLFPYLVPDVFLWVEVWRIRWKA